MDYEKEASKLDDYYDEYYIEGISDFYQYITYLKGLVIYEHLPVDAIIDSMPSPEIIKKDTLHITELARFYRCHLGMGYPTSYECTKIIASGHILVEQDEKIAYYISAAKEFVDGTFSTKEFMDSVRDRREKRLRKK
ncbi:MAG: hypothetical protein J6X02_04770 [Bacilli bacterium]|nr:hypothetical protein [Bacilli bacterium]